jgi:hypothetical protein
MTPGFPSSVALLGVVRNDRAYNIGAATAIWTVGQLTGFRRVFTYLPAIHIAGGDFTARLVR